MPILIALIVTVAGVLYILQAGANATLSKGLGQPILAALAISAATAWARGASSAAS